MLSVAEGVLGAAGALAVIMAAGTIVAIVHDWLWHLPGRVYRRVRG